MSFPFIKKILCPVDFDQSAEAVLAIVAKLASANDGTVYLPHVVPMAIPPTGMPIYVDIYQGQEEAAGARLSELAHKHLVGHWMTANPTTADCTDTRAAVQARMTEGNFRWMPMRKDSHAIGIITDRDTRRTSGDLENSRSRPR